MSAVPVREPIEPRLRRLLLRAIVVVSVVTVLVSFAGWVSAVALGGATVDPDRPYVWRSGSAIFLANSWGHPVTCSIVHDGQTDTVRLPAGDGTAVRGARVVRRSAAPETVTCDDFGINVSHGPMLATYRLASWPASLPLGAAVLIVLALYRRRERHGLLTPWRRVR